MKTKTPTTNRWERSRRELLRDLGLGAACLPLLQAGQARGAGSPKNLIIIAAVNGYQMPAWLPPDGPLGAAALPKSTSPLEPYNSDLIFLHDLANKSLPACTTCGPDGYDVLYYGLPPGGQAQGTTVDQVVGQALSTATTSQVLSSFAAAVQVDLPPGMLPPAQSRAFWAGPGQPINPLLDPVATYASLFTGRQTSPSADLVKLLAEKRSILDYVSASLDRFRKRLGTGDQAVVGQHLQAVRDLELELAPLAPTAACGGDPGAPINITDTGQYPKVLDAFLGLIVAALRCGMTQVATLQLSNYLGNNMNLGAFIPGIPVRATGYSQNPYQTWNNLAQNPVYNGTDLKQIVDQWWMTKLADFVGQLKTTPDASGQPLLASSVVLWGNTIQNWARRDGQALPWILAGSAGGYFKTGQCLGGNNTAMVFADLCNALGVTSHPYGAPYPGLAA